MTGLFPQQQVVEISYTTTPLPKKVSLNLPCDRSSKNNSDRRVNPVKGNASKVPLSVEERAETAEELSGDGGAG